MSRPPPEIAVGPHSVRLAATALVGAGVAAGIGQVVLVRELMNIAAGNELTIGLMLAAWFGWGALGASWAGHRAARDRAAHWSRFRVVLLAVFQFLTLTWCVGLVRMMPVFLARLPAPLSVQPGEVMGLLHLLAVTVICVCPAALVSGVQFAAGLNLYARLKPDAAASGQAYALDAAGHLVGGVLTAVFLWRGLGAQPLAAAVAGAAFLGAVMIAALPMDRFRLRLPLLALIALLVVLLRPGLELTSLLRLALKDQHPLAELDTIHGSLGVTRYGQSGAYFYINGAPAFAAPPTPGMQYLVHFSLLQAPQPRRVLLIGGGLAGALREVLKHGPESVDYVELDAKLIELGRRYLAALDRAALADPRVHVHALDGRRFVKLAARGQSPPYDAALVAMPEPATAQVNRFYTVDFFSEVARLLTPEGVIGFEMPSSDTYLGDELLRLNAVLLRSVQMVFPQTAILPGNPLVVAASRTSRLSEDSTELRRRLDSRGIQAVEFRAHVWDRLFPLELRGLRDTLQGAPAAINTDALPLGYFYGQAYWVAQHSRTSWTIFEWLSRLRLWRVILVIAVAMALATILVSHARSPRTAAVSVTLFGTGAIAMVLEVALLFGFQTQYGYVYGQLGVITGAFMVGLACGGLWAASRVQRLEPRQALSAVAKVQALVTLEALLTPFIALRLGETPVLGEVIPNVVFPLCTALLGLAVGLQFPLAARAGYEVEAAQSGARLYAADLLGACLGALVAGAILLPVLGVAGACFSAGALSAGLVVLLVVAGFSRTT